MDEQRRTIVCPACGGAARVTTAVEMAADGRALVRVIRYSCPQHDLVPEQTVLTALGEAAATGSSR